MKILLGGWVAVLLFVTSSDAGVGGHAMDALRNLAQAIGADLIDAPEPTGSASVPAPEIPPAPVAPELVPESPPPEPFISDTTV